VKEKGASRILNVEGDTFLFEISKGFQKVVLSYPTMWSAKVGNDMNPQAASIAPIVRRHGDILQGGG